MIEYYGAARGDRVFYEMADWCNQQFKNLDRKSTRLNSSHSQQSRMPSSA